jgi:hypothetical protein
LCPLNQLGVNEEVMMTERQNHGRFG